MFPSSTMCTRLCTLRTGIIVMRLKVQADNHNGDHQFPVFWDGRRTVLNAGLQSAKSRPHACTMTKLVCCSFLYPNILEHSLIYILVNDDSDLVSGFFKNILSALSSIIMHISPSFTLSYIITHYPSLLCVCFEKFLAYHLWRTIFFMKSFWQTFGEQLYRKVTKSSLQSRRTKRFAASLPQHLLFIAVNSKWKCQCTAVVPQWYTI